MTSHGSGLFLGTITGLGVTAVDAHPRKVCSCLAPTRVRRCWAFMGGTLLHPSLAGRYRGNVAERRRSPSCLSHDLSPKLWVLSTATGAAGGHCGVAGVQLGVVSWVCTSCHVRTPWRDVPAPKVTVLAGTRLPSPAPCAGHGTCSSGLFTALSPWGWHLSPCLCAPSLFPARVLCPGSRDDTYLSPVCAVAAVSCLLHVPVQVPSEFPVTPVSSARLCHLVSHVSAVPFPLLEPRMVQCPLRAFCVPCAGPTRPLCVPWKSPYVLPACALLVSSVSSFILCVPINPHARPRCVPDVSPQPRHVPYAAHMSHVSLHASHVSPRPVPRVSPAAPERPRAVAASHPLPSRSL